MSLPITQNAEEFFEEYFLKEEGFMKSKDLKEDIARWSDEIPEQFYYYEEIEADGKTGDNYVVAYWDECVSKWREEAKEEGDPEHFLVSLWVLPQQLTKADHDVLNQDFSSLIGQRESKHLVFGMKRKISGLPPIDPIATWVKCAEARAKLVLKKLQGSSTDDTTIAAQGGEEEVEDVIDLENHPARRYASEVLHLLGYIIEDTTVDGAQHTADMLRMRDDTTRDDKGFVVVVDIPKAGHPRAVEVLRISDNGFAGTMRGLLGTSS